MNTKKMMNVILLLGIFWYCYLGYVMLCELRLHPIFLLLLTGLLGLFVQTLRPLRTYLNQKQLLMQNNQANDRHRRENAHEL